MLPGESTFYEASKAYILQRAFAPFSRSRTANLRQETKNYIGGRINFDLITQVIIRSSESCHSKLVKCCVDVIIDKYVCEGQNRRPYDRRATHFKACHQPQGNWRTLQFSLLAAHGYNIC